jgi:hypothetical protein
LSEEVPYLQASGLLEKHRSTGGRAAAHHLIPRDQFYHLAMSPSAKNHFFCGHLLLLFACMHGCIMLCFSSQLKRGKKMEDRREQRERSRSRDRDGDRGDARDDQQMQNEGQNLYVTNLSFQVCGTVNA